MLGNYYLVSSSLCFVFCSRTVVCMQLHLILHDGKWNYFWLVWFWFDRPFLKETLSWCTMLHTVNVQHHTFNSTVFIIICHYSCNPSVILRTAPSQNLGQHTSSLRCYKEEGVRRVRKPQNRTEIRQKTAKRIGFFPKYRNWTYMEATIWKLTSARILIYSDNIVR